MWKFDLIILLLFIFSVFLFFFKKRNFSFIFFTFLILIKISISLIININDSKKYSHSAYYNYIIDADGYTNQARKYINENSHNKVKNFKYDYLNLNYLISNYNDEYLLKKNKKKKINIINRELKIFPKIDYVKKITSVKEGKNVILFGHDDGYISVIEKKNLTKIKEINTKTNDLISALNFINDEIYFGTINGKIGKISNNNYVEIFSNKHISAINNIKDFNKVIYSSGIDGSLRRLNEKELELIFISEQIITDFEFYNDKILISRLSSDFLKCSDKINISCKSLGDGLNSFTKIILSENKIILSDIFGGVTVLEIESLQKLNDPKNLIFDYKANHKSAITFIDYDLKNNFLISFSNDGYLISQDLNLKKKNKIQIFTSEKKKIFNLFGDEFRLPGYPILIAFSMKVLSIVDFNSIIILQKIILLVIVVSIFFIFKNKFNFYEQIIYSSFFLLPFSTIIQYSDRDLTEFILFILFSILLYFQFVKKKFFLIISILIILIGSFIKSTFTILILIWLVVNLVINFFFKKKKYNLILIIFTISIFYFINYNFKEQSKYNFRILPSHIISLLSDDLLTLRKVDKNIANYIEEINKDILDPKLKEKYIFYMLSNISYSVTDIIYNNKIFSDDEIKKISFEILKKKYFSYFYKNFINKVYEIKQIHLFPGSFGNVYFKDKGYYFIHYTVLLFAYFTLLIFFYGIYKFFVQNIVNSLKFLLFSFFYIAMYLFFHDSFNQRYFFPIGVIYYFYLFIGFDHLVKKIKYLN